MLEIRDELLDGFDHLSLGEVVVGKEGFQLAEEDVHLVHVVTCGLLHHAQGLEALHIDFFTGYVELFVGFFACGVGSKIYYRIF